jgi:hypothetical protein
MLLPLAVLLLSTIANAPSLSAENVRSSLSLLLLFVIFVTPLDYKSSRMVAHTIAWLPVFVVAYGAILSIVGEHTLFKVDFLGNSRLQGATIAAYLGAIGLPATVIAVRMLSLRWAWSWFGLAATNLAILVATGARMPLVLAIFCSSLGYLHTVIRRGRGAGILITSFTLLLTVLPAILIFGSKFGRFADFDNGADYTSGRALLWSLLTDEPVFEHPLGHGVGAATALLRNAKLKIGTIAPHNEYIRFYYDFGLLPTIIIFVWILWAFKAASLRLPGTVGRSDPEIWPSLYLIGLLVFCVTDNVFTMTPSLTLLIALPALRGLGLYKEIAASTRPSPTFSTRVSNLKPESL